MTRLPFGLIAATLLSSGCVPVPNPIGDIDKAEPDKELIGTWENPKENLDFVVDRPEVKGNPLGLMRVTWRKIKPKPNDQDVSLFFYTATAGKHTYANVLLNASNLNEEGNFAKWDKDSRTYCVVKIERKDDQLSINVGNGDAFHELMIREKFIPNTGSGGYRVPPEWLAGYLTKTGPDAIFTDGGAATFDRVKGK